VRSARNLSPRTSAKALRFIRKPFSQEKNETGFAPLLGDTASGAGGSFRAHQSVAFVR
jgi:hypothetical protein